MSKEKGKAVAEKEKKPRKARKQTVASQFKTVHKDILAKEKKFNKANKFAEKAASALETFLNLQKVEVPEELKESLNKLIADCEAFKESTIKIAEKIGNEFDAFVHNLPVAFTLPAVSTEDSE